MRAVFPLSACPALVLLISAMSSLADEPTRLMVYLETPRSSVSTELSVAGLSLRDEGGYRPLALETTRLESQELADRQILLANALVGPGRYDSLHLSVSSVTGHVGVAEVQPGVPAEGVSVSLDLELERGQTRTVFLRWTPSHVDPDKDLHVPRIEGLNPEVPPLGSLAFATSRGSGAVMVINRLDGKVVGALAVDEDPRGLAYSAKDQTLFVALGGKDAIAVIDVLSLRLINVVPLQYGDDPSRLLLSRDGDSLFVLGPGSRTLTSLSVYSLQQQFRVAVGEGPRSLAQDPVSGMVFVACEDEGRVEIIDPGTGMVENSLTLVSAPVEIVIGEQSRRLFVGGSAQRIIRSYDLASEDSEGDQNICGPVGGLAINPRTLRLYASVPSCRNLAVIRPDLGIEFGSVNLPGSPGLISFDRDFGHLWVVLPRDGMIAVCNVNKGKVDGVVQVGSDPFEVLVP